jgi:glycosyltransferase involved in cell wall biosynthesis
MDNLPANGFGSVMPLRIAFLTATFATEPDGGGMGAYLHRLTKVLHELGHEPEVFTLSQERPGVITFDKIRVERVGMPDTLPLRALRRLSRLHPKLDISEVGEYVLAALGLARAFYARDREKRFDLVQSSDYGLAGLFIHQHPSRRHLVRCSWVADLFIRADGEFDKLSSRLYCRLERYCIRKADIAYAPSEFVARHYKQEHGLQVEVLRPPFMLETEAASTLPWDLPERYFMYFGAIGPRKGADVLAAALPAVWLEEPEFTMVWAGKSWGGTIENYRRAWGEHASRVQWLGYIVAKAQLYAILQRAEAVVIPSRVDNLPNTLIESLLLHVPIIGSLGASIDELVEPGTNGELVRIGDPKTLAEAMLKAWRREGFWQCRKSHRPSILQQMEPSVAAANFLRLAGMPASRRSAGFRDA